MPPRDMDLRRTVRACCAQVMRALGAGHREAVYQRALCTALNRQGLCHRTEVSCPILFMDEIVGVGRADLIVGDVVVEVKATQCAPAAPSLKQLRKYIKSFSEVEKERFVGLVVNFNQCTGKVDFADVTPPAARKVSAAFLRSVDAVPRRVPPWARKRA